MFTPRADSSRTRYTRARGETTLSLMLGLSIGALVLAGLFMFWINGNVFHKNATDLTAKESSGLTALNRVATAVTDASAVALADENQIVLIPDKDKPGIDGAESVAKTLKVKTKQVKIVEPRGSCTDAKEWVVGGLTRQQLDILIEQASNL